MTLKKTHMYLSRITLLWGILLLLSLFPLDILANSLQQDVQTAIHDINPEVQDVREVDEAKLFREWQYLLFQIVGIVTIVMILWIGVKFLFAKGNLEEFKEESKAAIFIVIGLAIIPLSYFLIRYLTDLNL